MWWRIALIVTMDGLIGWVCLRPIGLAMLGHPGPSYSEGPTFAAIELGVLVVALFWANFVFARRVVRTLQARRIRVQGFD